MKESGVIGMILGVFVGVGLYLLASTLLELKVEFILFSVGFALTIMGIIIIILWKLL